ncbi:LemA family protein [Shewanella yunxiaonensis]|uniref:LemA family protein n=1 Tax=Shewanella yunxiaonensis TaxID=2829809 RepID=A0ABX7YRG4_9GAMM|nr:MULTISPECIES: LemA family protein [Shewanella]MDF0535882.1 LemA family protein [Shewanella sp. A32]QUN05322.1 LemA family protein [Shewanella yunxiaonensis]
MSALIMLIIVVAAVVLAIIVIHNSIIGRYNATQRAWSDVIAQERQKNKILPSLEQVAAQYSEYEKGLLEKVTALRSALAALSADTIDTKGLAKAESHMSEVVKGLNIAVEAYPELKASELFSKLMREITEQQENIGAAVRIFNRNVELFNNGIEVFPNNLVNSTFTHKHRLDTFDDSEAAAGFEYKPNF